MNPNERILKLLAEGKITAEDAAKLLDAVRRSYTIDDVCCDAFNRRVHKRIIERGLRFPHFRHGRFFRHGPRKFFTRMNNSCCDDVENLETVRLDRCPAHD